MKTPLRLALILGLLATGLACGSGSGGGGGASSVAPGVFAKAYSTVVVEVDYGVDASPYTGALASFGDTWTITRSNLQRLFEGTGKTVTVPSALSEMEALADVTSGNFTLDQIQGIAHAHRSQTTGGSTFGYYVVFLPGYLLDGGTVQTNVLGVTLGSSGVVALFKPVIASTGPAGSNLVRFVEQSVLVHELGHAVGLVNNGVALASEHQDLAHGAHCTNQACVMYYLNEGPVDARAFAVNYVKTSSTILFGSECLADTDAAIASAK